MRSKEQYSIYTLLCQALKTCNPSSSLFSCQTTEHCAQLISSALRPSGVLHKVHTFCTCVRSLKIHDVFLPNTNTDNISEARQFPSSSTQHSDCGWRWCRATSSRWSGVFHHSREVQRLDPSIQTWTDTRSCVYSEDSVRDAMQRKPAEPIIYRCRATRHTWRMTRENKTRRHDTTRQRSAAKNGKQFLIHFDATLVPPNAFPRASSDLPVQHLKTDLHI